MKEKVAAFQKFVPLLHAVCNQGMRDRHWEVVADETGIEVSGESTASLKYLLDADILESLPRLTEISDTASREWSIEKALGKMLSDWAELQFELAPWKETGATRACCASTAQVRMHYRRRSFMLACPDVEVATHPSKRTCIWPAGQCGD